MTSTVEDIRLHGKRIGADISRAVTGKAPLKRTISGASSITLVLSDPNMKMLRKPFARQATTLVVDGLNFRMVGVKHSGGSTTLTFEDAAVARLRAKRGPRKMSRDRLTRAQFIGRLAADAGVPFVSPERRIVQPIAKRSKAKRTVEKNERREHGFDAGANIKVKGVRANSSQRKIAEEILDECVRRNANFRVMVLAIACATQESNMADLVVGDAAHPDSHGPFGQWDGAYSPWNRTVAGATRGFLMGTPNGDHFGMIEYQRKNPKVEFTASIHAVQRNHSSNTWMYGKWKEEARNTVREYLGGEGTGSTTITTEVEKPYSFEVKKNENYWQAIQRLAKEVNWRAFVTAGKLYYFTDQRLLTSRPRMRVTSDFANNGTRNFPPGIDNVTFEVHGGKRVESASISGRAGRWAAPPGSAVIFADDFGAASGRWLVSSITTNLGDRDASIKLSRLRKPLPEPAPQTATRSVTVPGRGRGSAAAAGAEKAVRWAKQQVGTQEGSAKYNKWMSAVGGYDPWCSFWIGYLMREVCGLQCSGFGHSDYWSSWSGADRVSTSNMEPGDLVGYSGAHVAMYIGGGRCVSGNYSSAVTEHALNAHPSPVSYAVRPKYGD